MDVSCLHYITGFLDCAVYNIIELSEFGEPAEILESWKGIMGKVAQYKDEENRVDIVLYPRIEEPVTGSAMC